MSKKAKKAKPAHSDFAVGKAERFALGTFLSDYPDDLSFDEVLALLKDDDRDEDIDLSVAQAFEDYPTSFVIEQIIDSRDNILSWFGAEMDTTVAVSALDSLPAWSDLGLERSKDIGEVVAKAQRICIHKPWTDDEREAIGEVFEYFPDSSIWFEDILTRLESGDQVLFDQRVDANLTTGKEVADSLRRALEDLRVARQEVEQSLAEGVSPCAGAIQSDSSWVEQSLAEGSRHDRALHSAHGKARRRVRTLLDADGLSAREIIW